MKKVVFLLVMLMVLIPFNISARFGGSHSYHSGYHSSSRPSCYRTSGHTYKPSSTSRNHSTTVRTVRPYTHVSPHVSNMTQKQTSYYHNNPSYRCVGGIYRPVYHYQPNYLFWYFVLSNRHTNRNDTIKAKSKEELDRKVKTIKSEW